jgi:hypothetical protein
MLLTNHMPPVEFVVPAYSERRALAFAVVVLIALPVDSGLDAILHMAMLAVLLVLPNMVPHMVPYMILLVQAAPAAVNMCAVKAGEVVAALPVILPLLLFVILLLHPVNPATLCLVIVPVLADVVAVPLMIQRIELVAIVDPAVVEMLVFGEAAPGCRKVWMAEA